MDSTSVVETQTKETEGIMADFEFHGEGGTLTLSAKGILNGAGWDLVYAYGVDYDPVAALSAPPVKIAENVISAAAGYNYGLYVTADGILHFIGDSGIPYAERFAFDGRIRRVFAEADRDVFSLEDEKGDIWRWGCNFASELADRLTVPRAVLDDQVVTAKRGKAIWCYEAEGQTHYYKGILYENVGSSALATLRQRAVLHEEFRHLSAQYGADNMMLKYVLRNRSPKREIRSPDWSEEAYERCEDVGFPFGPQVVNRRQFAYSGTAEELTYSIGIYTENRYLFQPIKCK